MWFVLGILSGLFFALMGVFSKRAVTKSNIYLVGFGQWLFALPVLFLAIFWLDWKIVNGHQFWYAFAVTVPLNILGTYIFLKSLSLEDISLVMPILSFTPLFLILTSNIILRELPSLIGIVGILLIVLGSYVLGLNKKSKLLEPISYLFSNKAARLMLFLAFTYSISSNFDKIAILNSSPLTFAIISSLFITAFFFLLVAKQSGFGISHFKTNFKYLLPVGFFWGLMTITQMTAINTGLVSYVISLKRTGGVFSVIFGFFFFRERNIKNRLIGASLMIIGAFLISQG